MDWKENLIQLNDIILTEHVVQKLANKDVLSLKLIRPFCSVFAYDKIQCMVTDFIKIDKWMCGTCNKNLESSASVMYEICVD